MFWGQENTHTSVCVCVCGRDTSMGQQGQYAYGIAGHFESSSEAAGITCILHMSPGTIHTTVVLR